jgi:hypothetical protein
VLCRPREGWTYASALDDELPGKVVGWVPTMFLTDSMANQPACTYCVLDLGIATTPLPSADAWQWPRCHCTLGYLPHLSPDAIMRAVRQGNDLVDKFARDGDLPVYTHRLQGRHKRRVRGPSMCHLFVTLFVVCHVWFVVEMFINCCVQCVMFVVVVLLCVVCLPCYLCGLSCFVCSVVICA